GQARGLGPRRWIGPAGRIGQAPGPGPPRRIGPAGPVGQGRRPWPPPWGRPVAWAWRTGSARGSDRPGSPWLDAGRGGGPVGGSSAEPERSHGGISLRLPSSPTPAANLALLRLAPRRGCLPNRLSQPTRTSPVRSQHGT